MNTSRTMHSTTIHARERGFRISSDAMSEE
jgi:hypothetical protein